MPSISVRDQGVGRKVGDGNLGLDADVRTESAARCGVRGCKTVVALTQD
jgi:hypothetical protein